MLTPASRADRNRLSLFQQRRKVSQHFVGEAFVSLSLDAHERNVFVAMSIRQAHRPLHLRVDRIARREIIFGSDKISNRQPAALRRGRDVPLIHPLPR
jgi:hypothetical protein